MEGRGLEGWGLVEGRGLVERRGPGRGGAGLLGVGDGVSCHARLQGGSKLKPVPSSHLCQNSLVPRGALVISW